MIVENYCRQNGITLVREFVDDGYSGGNFNRPGFKEMLKQLEQGKANLVITKDLSRLGRDMREASYYAEQFFPEHGIQYIAIADNFDTEHDNIIALFLFAMNEVYLRDGSRKVKDVLKSKRESGQYCACPPYGYRKDQEDKHHLAPDEMTAPVVKRILKNQVYLGHTMLGKSRKVSVKSKKKVAVPRDGWVVTRDTHPPLVDKALFQRTQENLGRGTRNYQAYDHVRKSIFGGVAVCGKCGHSLCSCGTVYKGEREKYWYLSCTHQRQDVANPCQGVRIRYADLVELVRQDLNSLLALSDEKVETLVQEAARRMGSEENLKIRQMKRERAEARLTTIDKIVTKLYTDNASGKLDDERLDRMVADLEKESAGLKAILEALNAPSPAQRMADSYAQFFALARSYTHLEQLDRDTLLAFVDRIEVGPKLYENGAHKVPARANHPYRQSVRIFYKFIGELTENSGKCSDEKPA